MRKHNGMRPQDIVVLLKILALRTENWRAKQLADALSLSASEISESLNRSVLAGLVSGDKKRVYTNALFEFIQYGLHYVFPAAPGAMVNGIYTAHSHPFMQKRFKSEINYVWPYEKGKVRGLAIEPLYNKVTEAIQKDEVLYKMLALVDVLRVGRVREIKFAVAELKKIMDESL